MFSNRHTQHQLVAWGDESIRVTAPIPAYLMSAVILPEPHNLSELAKVKPKGAVKLHWRELTDKLRRDALTCIADLGGYGAIVIGSPLPKKKQERGRRKCLEALLPELEKQGVGTLKLESRVLQLNSKDIELLDALRSKHAISAIGVDHAYADEEMSLWVPDIILGAYGDSLCGNSREIWQRPWEAILPNLTILEAAIK